MTAQPHSMPEYMQNITPADMSAYVWPRTGYFLLLMLDMARLSIIAYISCLGICAFIMLSVVTVRHI